MEDHLVLTQQSLRKAGMELQELDKIKQGGQPDQGQKGNKKKKKKKKQEKEEAPEMESDLKFEEDPIPESK